MQYKFLEHTADIMFEAYGKSYEEALQNAAAAMFFVIGEAKPLEHRHFSVSAQNIEELTVFALSDLLTSSDTDDFIFSKISVKQFDASKLTLEIDAYGEKKRPLMSVKAVTYHELLVKEEKDGWTIRILIDV